MKNSDSHKSKSVAPASGTKSPWQGRILGVYKPPGMTSHDAIDEHAHASVGIAPGKDS